MQVIPNEVRNLLRMSANPQGISHGVYTERSECVRNDIMKILVKTRRNKK